SRWDALTHTLKHLLGYHEVSHTESGIIFQAAVGQGTGEILIQKQTGHNEKPGRGSVHHVAIRVKDDTELRYWQQQIRKQGFHTTEVLDRYYFKSLYFRESNGVLFEIATDGPGFAIAGQGEETSKELSLPPFLEEQ